MRENGEQLMDSPDSESYRAMQATLTMLEDRYNNLRTMADDKGRQLQVSLCTISLFQTISLGAGTIDCLLKNQIVPSGKRKNNNANIRSILPFKWRLGKGNNFFFSKYKFVSTIQNIILII